MKLINGDCYTELNKIEDNSIDLVIIDPPYLINQGKSGGAFGADKQLYHKDIAHLTKGFDLSILDLIAKKQKKTNMYIFCNKELLFDLISHFRKNKKMLMDLLTWEKTNPIPTCHNKYLSDMEYILFIKEKGVKINGSFQTKRKNYRSNLNVVDKKLYNHPTIKPIPLLKNYIINSSSEGDTVLDCFMGSGSTGVACKQLNRNFIGIELDKEYFKTAKKRISNGV